MEQRRLLLFGILSAAIIILYPIMARQIWGPQPPENPPVAAQGDKKDAEKDKKPAEAKKTPDKEVAPAQAELKPAAEKPAVAQNDQSGEFKEPVEKPIEQEWVTLGSVDPNDPYRMMVTLTNRGAALERIELSSNTYRDIDVRTGYLGRVATDTKANAQGCPVQVVGPGTPAAKAGLKVGDYIKSVDGMEVNSKESLEIALENKECKPGRTIDVVILRDGRQQTLQATLTRHPLEVIRPAADDPLFTEKQDDPLSMLLTLQQIDKDAIPDDDKISKEFEGQKLSEDEINKKILDRELAGVSLRDGVWKIDANDKPDAEHVTFKRKIWKSCLEIHKTYRLAKVPVEAMSDPNHPSYHLTLEVKIVNTSNDKEIDDRDPRKNQTHEIAYRLDGPNGLPTEGYWYANKVCPNWWEAAGLRDVVVSFDEAEPKMVTCSRIPTPGKKDIWIGQSLTFIGVDAQYFSAITIPQYSKPRELWFASSQPLHVSKIDPNHRNWTNTSIRMVGLPTTLKPGESLKQEYKIFAGPKTPELLDQYGLGNLLYYGWPIFGFFAKILQVVLHFFYGIVGNYGIAIIMLTILVRGLMFPISFKQAIGAQKMALIQPEMKKITEKHKGDMEARNKAMQELYRKHNYNPFSGCLPIFLQLPIFIGLYRALMVDVQLRDAPLISHAVRWCSNLSAPDMLFYWNDFLPVFLFGWLGPYFNILPILTICLFLWQQHVMMPPATDEQQAMQQKMMKYMMIFMGVMFFKVASGLCIYFVASTLWGLGERQFLPKKDASSAGNISSPRAALSENGGGQARRKKNRDRR